METLKIILSLAVIADLTYSIVSFLGFIPLGKAWIIPRFPLLVTLIIILVQTKQRNRKFYCEKCHENLTREQVTGICVCGQRNKIKFMGPSGRLYYKCKNRGCKNTKVISLSHAARTRLSRLNPYGKRMLSRRTIVCNTCGSKIIGETTVTLSLYSGNEELALNYREDFFFHGLGKFRENPSLNVVPFYSTDFQMKAIDNHYVNSSESVPKEELKLHFKTNNSVVNQTLYQFSVAIAKNNACTLKNCEGIILLLDGAASSIERQSVVDYFIIDLKQLNTQNAVWTRPVLVGVCCNGVPNLEAVIDQFAVQSADASEHICKQYLMEQNNSDILNLLAGNIQNVHYFIYRTGSAAQGTQNKVCNVINPAQALLYSVQNEVGLVWQPSSNGWCPKI